MTKNDEKIHWSETKIFWAIAATAIVAVYFFGLTIPLVGPDEPRYAQVAREMFERGDWVTPTLGGYNWFEKPALLYWLEIASYHIFGVNEFAARVGSALFGLGTVASLWILGRRLATEETENLRNDPGNWLALIAASSIGVIVFARGASFDIILTFPVTAALVSYFIFDQAEIYGRNLKPPAIAVDTGKHRGAFLSLLLFYFFIGVALLAKGLVGIVFPFAIVVFYHVLSWKLPSRTPLLSLFWGTAFSAAVASAWYLPMYLTHGWSFIDEFFIQHHFQRYTSNKYFHPQPFYFFLWALPLMTIPWLPFFVLGIWNGAKDIFNRRDAETPREKRSKNPPAPAHGSHKSLLLFSFAWLLVPLVFFSFSGSKLPGYILPSLPPALIITAVYVSKFVGASTRRGLLIKGIAAATFATVIALLLTVVPKFAANDSVKELIAEATRRGYGDAEVLNLHMISHNAEFYAAGRLLRSSDGKQRRLWGPAEVQQEIIHRKGEAVLVIVPLEDLKQLTESPTFASEQIAQNSEIAIVAVKLRQS
jgi:4-amino-4-deoxy-L-arabinose transferase-like glycosyltransferase